MNGLRGDVERGGVEEGTRRGAGVGAAAPSPPPPPSPLLPAPCLYVSGLGSDGERGGKEEGSRRGAGAGAAALSPSPPRPPPPALLPALGLDVNLNRNLFFGGRTTFSAISASMFLQFLPCVSTDC